LITRRLPYAGRIRSAVPVREDYSGRSGYVTHATAQQLLVGGRADRDPGPARFKLTPLGRDVLAALLKPPVNEQGGALSRRSRSGEVKPPGPPGRVEHVVIPTRRADYRHARSRSA